MRTDLVYSRALGIREAGKSRMGSKGTGVGRWIGAWCAADEQLVDVHHFV